MEDDPLSALRAILESAKDVPEAAPFRASGEPLKALISTLKGEEPPVATAPQKVGQNPARERELGREVFALIAGNPLSPNARTEAVERTLRALEDPTSENIRSILSALLRD